MSDSAAINQRYFKSDHLLLDLQARSVRGSAVTIVGQAATFALKLGSMVVLARLLAPADFGLIAMVTAVTGIIGVFRTMGLPMATVQRAQINHQQVSTLLWINLSVSCLLCITTAASAPVLAWLYAEPRLVAITLALSTVSILAGLAVQHQALLRRQMRFGALAAANVGSLAVGVTTAVILALLGAGYWALVFMLIATALADTILAWVVCDWRPGWPRRVQGIRSMVTYGCSCTGSSLLGRLCLSLDNILIGAVWGAGSLGFYTRAYDLLQLPASQISAPVNRIALTGLSRLQNDPAKYRRYVCTCITVIVALGMPITAFAYADAEQLIVLVLGEAWREVVPIFRWLAPAAFLGTFNVAALWLLLPLGRADRHLRWVLFRALYTVSAFAIGLPWGPQGVAAAYSGARCLLVVPELAYACAGTPVRLADVGGAVWRPAATSVAAAAMVALSHRFLPPPAGRLPGLLLDSAVFGGVYALAWFVLPGGRRVVVELLAHSRHLLGKRGYPRGFSTSC